MSFSINKSWVTCTVDMRVLPPAAERVAQVILPVVGIVRAKTGCVSCALTRDVEDGCRLRYSETWSGEAAFQRHTQSAEFRRVLLAMDMCSEEPEVTIGNLSGHSGMDYLRDLCASDHADRAKVAVGI